MVIVCGFLVAIAALIDDRFADQIVPEERFRIFHPVPDMFGMAVMAFGIFQLPMKTV
jgi:hypothetical protein